MELGLYSFAELTPDPVTGEIITPRQRLADLLDEAELADRLGLDVFALGEHHRPDFVSSAPAVVLAAIAQRTERIRLSSAVTVLSSDDPVRVFQQFSTLDLLSGGRAEIMAGRGSFIESFPLFGYDLKDYDDLFVDKLDLLLKLRESENVTWTGRFRAPLNDLGVYPRPVQDPLPIWVGVGGNARSAIRAGMLGLPMALAIIGGTTPPFVPLVQYFRAAAEQAGHDPVKLPLSINSHGFIASSSETAFEEAFRYTEPMFKKIGAERGWSGFTKDRFRAEMELPGALVAGTPQQVVDKILYQYDLFGHQRFLLQISTGTMPHEMVMEAIRLYATEVAPAVRAEIARRQEISQLITLA